LQEWKKINIGIFGTRIAPYDPQEMHYKYLKEQLSAARCDRV
jgi:hypothetical protein